MFTFLDENVDKHVQNNVIEPETADRAKAFFHALPLHLPPPHIVASPAKLSFYWFYKQDRVEVCLDDTQFTWIGRFNGTVERGSDPWGGTQLDPFLAMLTRLYDGSGYEP